MKTMPTTPPAYSQGSAGNSRRAPVLARSIQLAMASTTVPARKLTKLALSTEPDAPRSCPLTACCHEVPAPATKGSTSSHHGTPVCRRSDTAHATAPTASSAPSIRASVSGFAGIVPRSEEHTSELQSRENLVCRLLLEKKKKRTIT